MVLVEVVVKLWWKKDDSCHEVDVDRYVNETTWKPYGLSLDPEERIERGVTGNRRAEWGKRCLCEASCAWQQRFWPCYALDLGKRVTEFWEYEFLFTLFVLENIICYIINAYLSHHHRSYILLTLFVLENIDMPLVKDNALVAAASEKYKIKQFGKTLNTYTFAQLPAHKKHKHENLLTTSNTNTFLHQVQIPSHIKYKYLLTTTRSLWRVTHSPLLLIVCLKF